MPSSKPARRFQDIIDNIEWIADDIAVMSEREFLGNRTIQDAVLFRLLRISEAAAKLGSDAETYAPGQPWPQIRAFGNALRHEYDGLAMGQVWIILKRDLPVLLQACAEAIVGLDAGGSQR